MVKTLVPSRLQPKYPLSGVCRAVSITLLLGAAAPAVQAAPWSDALIQRLQTHPLWVQADNQLDAAEAAGSAAAQPMYNPELELSYDNKTERAYQIGISQQWDRTNKSELLAQIGDKNEQIARLEQQQVRNELIATVLTNLIKQRRADALLVLAQEQLDIAQNLVTLTDKRQKAGDIGELDLQLVRLALTESIQKRTEAQNEAHRVKSERDTLLFDTNVSLPDQLFVGGNNTPDFKVLSQQLPEVLIAEARSQNALLNVRKAEKESKADPTFGVGFGQDGNDDVISLSFSMPLNVRNTYTAEIDAAQSLSKASDQALQNSMVRNISQLENDWQIFKRYQRQLQVHQGDRRQDMARLNDQLKKLWHLGDLTTTAYLQNLQQRNAAMSAEIEMEAQTSLSLVTWLKNSNQTLFWLQQQ